MEKQRLLILATDFAGTVGNFDSKSAEEILKLQKEFRNKLNVEFVWVIISGTTNYSMKKYVTKFNQLMSDVTKKEELIVELGFSKYGGAVFSQKYDEQELQALSLNYSKGECIRNVIAFYETLGYEIYTVLYAGDSSNDYSAFNTVKELPNYLSSSKCFAPENAISRIKDLADIVSDQSNIDGVIDCVEKWLQITK